MEFVGVHLGAAVPAAHGGGLRHGHGDSDDDVARRQPYLEREQGLPAGLAGKILSPANSTMD